MASIAELCWITSQDLFCDVDLDALYVRQVETMGVGESKSHPYMLLVHTGKITIGIFLEDDADTGDLTWDPQVDPCSSDEPLYFRNSH